MIQFLDLKFDDEEKAILNEFINKYNQEISIFYSIDVDKLSGGVKNPNRIIYINGQYLLEEKDDLKNWYMGMDYNNGYYFHGYYGNLTKTLYSL